MITGWGRANRAESGANDSTEIAGAFVASDLDVLNDVPHDGQAQFDVAAIRGRDVDVAPFDGNDP